MSKSWVSGSLRAEPLKASDSEWLHNNLFGNADVMRWYLDGRIFSRTETNKRVSSWCDRWHSEKLSCWLIRNSDEKIGFLSFREMDSKSIEVAYAFICKEWNKGLASAVLNGGLDWLDTIGSSNYKFVVATCHPDNIASSRVLQKNGFIVTQKALPSERLRNHYVKVLHHS